MWLGRQLSDVQKSVIRRLVVWAKPWSDLPELKVADLGRISERLIGLGKVVYCLDRCTAAVRQETAPYSTSGHRGTERASGYRDDRAAATKVIGRIKIDLLEVAKDIKPTRLNFPGSPSFDPRPWLDQETREAYENPKVLRLEEPTGPIPRVRVRANRSDMRALLDVWAGGGRLLLIPSHLAALRCGLFAVFKSDLVDRMILDARPPNCWERGLNK